MGRFFMKGRCTMRPLLTCITAALILGLALSGCSSDEKTSTDSSTQAAGEATTAAAQATEAPKPSEGASSSAAAVPGAKAEANHVRVYLNTINDPWTSDNQFIKPDAGKRFVYFDVTVEYFNDSDTHGANPFYFGVTDTTAFAYDPSLFGPDPQMHAVDLRPNEKTRGWVTFEVNQTAQLQKLRYKPNVFKDDYIEFNFQ